MVWIQSTIILNDKKLLRIIPEFRSPTAACYGSYRWFDNGNAFNVIGLADIVSLDGKGKRYTRKSGNYLNMIFVNEY